jgi:hypothetical protein
MPRFEFFDPNGVYEFVNSDKLPFLFTIRREIKSPFKEQLQKLNGRSKTPVIFYYEFR